MIPIRARGRALRAVCVAVVVVAVFAWHVPWPAPAQQQQAPPMRRAEMEAATAQAQAVLAAWRAGELARVQRLATRSQAADLETAVARQLWAATTVHEIGAPQPTVPLDGDLEFQFGWRAEFDAEAFVDAVLGQIRQQAEAAGHDADAVAAQLRQRRPTLETIAANHAARVAFSPQRFMMRQSGGDWRLHDWLTVRLGARQPHAAADLFLAAFAARDAVQARGALTPQLRQAFADRVGEHLLLGSAVRRHEREPADPVPAEATEAHLRVRWRVDFRPTWIQRQLVEEYRWELQYGEASETGEEATAADVARRLAEYEDEVERRTRAFAERVATFGAQLTLARIHDRWYVADIVPVDVTHDGGAETARGAVRQALQALQRHNFDEIDRLYDPARMDGLARGETGRLFAQALTITRFTLDDGEPRPIDGDAARVHVAYRWLARVDMRALQRSLREQYRRHAEAEGLSHEEIEATIRARAEALAAYVEQMRAELEAPRQVATLQRLGGRWYVQGLVTGEGE